MRPVELFPLVMDVLIVTRVFLLRFWVYIFQGQSHRLMFLRQGFRFLFDYDIVRHLVKGVLDRPRFVEGYPLSEIRLVPERFSERVNGHFVAYPARSLRSDRAGRAFHRYVATKLGSILVAT